MEIKKIPSKQLENFSKIFFQIGIVLSLFIVYVLAEHKTFEKDFNYHLTGVTMKKNIEEDIPIMNMRTVKPPPPKIALVVAQIKVVEDELKVEESVIETTETDENKAVVISNLSLNIDEVVEGEEVVEDIPFMLIQNVPIYPGCEGNNEVLKKCFSTKIQEYFSENFNVGLATELGLSEGRKRLFVVFRIDKKGNVVDIKSRGPHPVLEEEVEKILSKLPQMIPGKERGEPVTVSYSIPITFKVIF